MADTKLSALTLATAPMSYVYGISGTTPHKQIPMSFHNVKNYGAVGDGSNDDTSAIQAAIHAALNSGTAVHSTDGGGVVFFPPGEYLVSSSLTFETTRASIHLIGSGRHCTTIIGNFAGFIIEKPTDNTQNIEYIKGLGIYNARQNIDSGALHMSSTAGAIVEDCLLQGAIGAACEDEMYCTAFYNCTFVSSYPYPMAPGTIGIAMQQVGLYNCRFQLFAVGIATSNASPVIVGCATEVCGIGILAGAALPTNLSSHSLSFDAVQGMSVNGFQTERCETGIYVVQATGCNFSGITLTGTLGPWHRTSSITWSGGTATLNTPEPLSTWLPTGTTTFLVQIESANVSGYNTDPNFVTGTVVGTVAGGSTSFTYPVASNPGGSANSTAMWSRKIQYGLRIRGSGGNTFNGIAISADAEQAQTDLYVDGNTGILNTTLSGIAFGNLIVPPGPSKAGYKFIGTSTYSLNMTFADLPGQSGVQQTTAVQGMEYDITDSQVDVVGRYAFGSGSYNVTVQYDGTGWRVTKSAYAQGRAFSTLPTTNMSSHIGDMYNITDGAKLGGGTAAVGDSCQGGGSQALLIRYDGTHWIRVV